MSMFLEIQRHFYRKPLTFISSMNKIHPGGVELEHGVEARDRTAGPDHAGHAGGAEVADFIRGTCIKSTKNHRKTQK